MMQKVRTHSPVAGFFQFSQRPARPNGDRSRIAMAYGCFTFAPLIAIHSKKPSIGTMHRRLRYASRNIGSRPTVSALALIGGGFGLSLHQYGMSPHCSRSSERTGLRVLPDYPQLLARRAVVTGRHVAERIASDPVIPRVESIDDFEPELIGRARLDDASTHVIHVGAELAGRKRCG